MKEQMHEKYVTLRTEKGITDYQVSKDTGIPYTTLRDWSAGLYVPKIDKIMKIADYFNVPIDYFYAAQ